MRPTSAPAPSAGTAPRPASRGWPCCPAIPPGRPRRSNGFCFAGLSSIALNADTVTLPTSRALAFVVDCSTCKEFFLAAEGSALRPMAMQFDAAETVLDGSAPVLWSNMNAVFQGSPSYWWEGNADLDSLTGGLALNRLQRVTLAPSAAFAVIGVRGRRCRFGAEVAAALRARHRGADAAGRRRPRLGHAGTRRPRSPTTRRAIAAGANATQAVTLPNVQNGDFVQAGFTGGASAFVEWSAAVTTTGGTGTVTARATNRHGTLAIDLAAGTLLVRAVKPRA